MDLRRTFLPLTLLALVSSSAAWANVVSTPHVRAELLSATRGFAPGQEVEIALSLTLAPDWHVYWENPGDSGEAPTVEWTVPDGIQVGAWIWPRPRRIAMGPLANYGYENQVLLIASLKVPLSFTASSLPIQAFAKWLVCKEECIPEGGSLNLELPRESTKQASPTASLFEKTKSEWPRIVDGWKLEFRDKDKDVLEIMVESPPDIDLSAQQMEFFPRLPGLVEAGPEPKVDKTPHRVTFRFARTPYLSTLPTPLDGVFVAQAPQSNEALVLLLSGDRQPTSLSQGFWAALLSAFAGGLLLNLMPCVLPVLGLKVLALAQSAQKSLRERRRETLAFGAGVLVSFWILAGLLLVLRAGGQGLGWGFQLQSPGFVLFLSLLFAVMSLQFFGIFDFGDRLSAAAGRVRTPSGLAGSFGGGVLMTAVSTPCTAPFMGSALGTALALPAPLALLVFTALGIGMALPLSLVALFPGLSRYFPKPGRWMDRLKRALGVPLLVTAFWLLWIFALQTGLWTPGSSTLNLTWEKYSPDRVTELQREGRLVYVDFTASWCLTCQVNKRVVFSSDEVLTEVSKNNVALLRGDWTQRDPVVTRALESFGRSGVPLNVIYFPNSSREALVLPTVLTPGIVLEALRAPVP